MASPVSLTDRWPPRDRIGRQQLHRIALPTFFVQPSGIGRTIVEAFKQPVPDGFWNSDVDEEGEAIAIVSCPCGEDATVYPLRSAECDCGRFYLHLGTEVRVYRPEGVEATLPVRTSDAPPVARVD